MCFNYCRKEALLPSVFHNQKFVVSEKMLLRKSKVAKQRSKTLLPYIETWIWVVLILFAINFRLTLWWSVAQDMLSKRWKQGVVLKEYGLLRYLCCLFAAQSLQNRSITECQFRLRVLRRLLARLFLHKNLPCSGFPTAGLSICSAKCAKTTAHFPILSFRLCFWQKNCTLVSTKEPILKLCLPFAIWRILLLKQ